MVFSIQILNESNIIIFSLFKLYDKIVKIYCDTLFKYHKLYLFIIEFKFKYSAEN